jgi:hypothetical protein
VIHLYFRIAMSQALRRRTAGSGALTNPTPPADQSRSTSNTEQSQPELPNPLTLRAVGAIFQRRWAAPLTVAVLCLALHLFGFFEAPNAELTPTASAYDFRKKLELPLQYSKYGVGAGALFGSLMWLLVVSLSDSAEGKPQGPADHWAQNNSILLAVLLGLGMATGGILAFTFVAISDILRQGLAELH